VRDLEYVWFLRAANSLRDSLNHTRLVIAPIYETVRPMRGRIHTVAGVGILSASQWRSQFSVLVHGVPRGNLLESALDMRAWRKVGFGAVLGHLCMRDGLELLSR